MRFQVREHVLHMGTYRRYIWGHERVKMQTLCALPINFKLYVRISENYKIFSKLPLRGRVELPQ